MSREECACRAKGRLLIHVETPMEEAVTITMMEKGRYRSVYTVYLDAGRQELRLDHIAMGEVRVQSSVDGPHTFYYPSNTLLFEKDNYVHTLHIIDRRKKDEVQ